MATLRPGAPPWSGRRQLKQRFCQPRRQIQECHVLDLLARPAQTRTENFDKFDRHVRMVAQERHEIAPLDDNKLAVGHGGGIRGARPAVKQGDLTENLTLAKDVEHDVLALGRGNTHLDASGEHSHQPGAWVSFREYRGAPRHLPRLHIRPEMFDHRGREDPETRDDCGAGTTCPVFAPPAVCPLEST